MRALGALCCACFIGVQISAVQTQVMAAESVEDVVAILKAQDSQFDNVQLTYTMVGTNHLKDHSWKEFGNVESAADSSPKAMDLDYRHLDRMTIRGAEVSFLRTLDPQLASEQNPTKTMAWNNIGGVRTELVQYDPRFGSTPAKVEYSNHLGAVADGESEHRMCIEFAMGIGYGKRLKKIESVIADSDGFTLKGTIQLWNKDDSRCTLNIDRDYLVRKAVIDCNVNGNLTHIEADNRGVKRIAGFATPFAANGHYYRRWDGRIIDGQQKGTPKDSYQFDVIFEGLRFGLTDAEYTQDTTIVVPPGTLIVDPHGIAAARIMKEREGSGQRYRQYLIYGLLNAVALSGILGIFWVRSIRHRPPSPT